jgi:hypothetical protein
MTCNERSVTDGGAMNVGRWALGLMAVALAVGVAPVVRAGDAGQPARAVRLSSVDGQVQVSKGGEPLADSSVANTPLFEGTTVTTADDGRAEIQFEDGSVARISPNSSLTLTILRGTGASANAEITLDGGLAYFELQGAGQAGTTTVKFGDSVVTPSGFTVLRIGLDNPPGELAVFSGNAHLERGTAVAVELHGGESVALSANDVSQYTLNETIEPDSWDSWNSDRDQVMTSEAAAATGAAKNYGQSSNPAWNDLDASGNWYNVPGEGNVWSPADASNAGFDPYGNGNWMNSPGYGYMWVSGYPWGYLPYHCGLWNWYDGFGWGWAPGSGGCNPWWGAGGGYYGANVGRGYGGYHPPMRPHPPKRPLGTMIAVNRHVSTPGGPLPLRDKTSVVTIAGNTVLPMHAISPRQQYDRSASGYVNRTIVTNVGGVPATGQGRGVGPAFGTSRTAPAGTSGGARNTTTRSASPSRAAPSAPASHASSGGGGGAPAAHAGGGGGGHH